MASVTVSLRGKPQAKYSLTQERTRIGRAASNDIVLSSWRVSGAHAVLVQAGSTVAIEDLRSRNGTFVAGARIERADLADGSVVQIADFRLTVVATRPAKAYEPTLFVRPNPNTRQAYLQRVNGLPDEPVTALNKVVTVVGTAGVCVVTVIRRVDEFAVRFTEGGTPARLNGATLTDAPVRLQAGDVLEIGSDHLQFLMRDAAST